VFLQYIAGGHHDITKFMEGKTCILGSIIPRSYFMKRLNKLSRQPLRFEGQLSITVNIHKVELCINCHISGSNVVIEVFFSLLHAFLSARNRYHSWSSEL